MQQQNILETPITYLKGVGPKRAALLSSELNLKTFDDLLHYFPFRHIDRSKFYKISDLNDFTVYVQIKGFISKGKEVGKGRGKRYVAKLTDDTGNIELVWFKGISWVKDKFKNNTEYLIYGKPTLYNGKINITHPEVSELESEGNMGASLQAVYHSTEKLGSIGLGSKGFNRIIQNLILQVKDVIPETLNKDLINRYKLIPRREALINIHLPENSETLKRANIRLKYEELFFIQLHLIVERIIRTKKTPVISLRK